MVEVDVEGWGLKHGAGSGKWNRRFFQCVRASPLPALLAAADALDAATPEQGDTAPGAGRWGTVRDSVMGSNGPRVVYGKSAKDGKQGSIIKVRRSCVHRGCCLKRGY